ncbi:RNA polymerase II-associated protein 3 [Phytophthora boehmeriae]|uniref:RNA polymerase II-associated protein 3 n=1 Tax=Phytophthora boehmeriae TaxID=109152 RepID=A0A8T1X4U5_9STRA|nr:RNA polymerase II-associated protein 3 [Phytophthora boehmeriae]
MQDTALQKELQQLSPEELRALLSSAGHGQLLRETQVDEKLVAAAKDEGNALFRQGKTHEAIAAYSRCIAMDPSNAVCLSNRAAAYLKVFHAGATD